MSRAAAAAAGNTLLTECYDAEYKADVKRILQIIRDNVKNKAVLDITGEYNNTPLIVASDRGLTDVVNALLATELVDINTQTIYGRTALMCACANSHADIAVALLAQPRINVHAMDKEGFTALTLCDKTPVMAHVIKELEKESESDAPYFDGGSRRSRSRSRRVRNKRRSVKNKRRSMRAKSRSVSRHPPF